MGFVIDMHLCSVQLASDDIPDLFFGPVAIFSGPAEYLKPVPGRLASLPNTTIAEQPAIVCIAALI
jgi:hypothetical protein